MKKRRMLSYTALVLLFSALYLVYLGCRAGVIESPLVATHIFPSIRRLVSRGTDFKLWLRGTEKPKAPITVIAVDNDSLAKLGRWPWRRDLIALLVHQLKQMGVKTIGVDVLFAEALNPMNDEMADILVSRNEKDLIDAFDFDGRLAQTVKAYSNDVVLEWYTESTCRPLYRDCPNDNPPELPQNFSRFAFAVKGAQDLSASSVLTTRAVIPPLSRFTEVSTHLGFPNVNRDADGIPRQAPLAMQVDKNFYPSFSLAIAAAFQGQKISGELSRDGGYWKDIRLGERALPIDAFGELAVNFRGKMGTFQYVPAWKILEWQPPKDRQIASVSELDSLRGGIAILGATALALGDVHPTPFDPTVPGVEITANIVDNILSADSLQVSSLNLWLVLIVMTGGAALFLFAGERLEGRHFFAIVVFSFLGICVWDYAILFRGGQNAPTAILYLELAVCAATCLMFKYFAEEQKRKFIRMAFAKYVSPAVVDSLIGDPGQLSLGGTS